MCSKKVKKSVADNPVLLKEWDYEKNGDSKPENISYGSDKKCWWVCPRGHSYSARAKNRNEGKGCLECYRLVHYENSVAGKNPHLVEEWDYDKNIGLNPEEVSYGSDKKFWWKCPKGHSYDCRPSDRYRGCGCPKCCRSKGENKTASTLIKLKKKYEEQWKFVTPFIRRYQFDFMVFDKSYYGIIEYHGRQHWTPVSFRSKKNNDKNDKIKSLKGNMKRDYIKYEYCIMRGINLFIIPFWEYENIHSILKDLFDNKRPVCSSPPEFVMKHAELRQSIRQEFKLFDKDVFSGFLEDYI